MRRLDLRNPRKKTTLGHREQRKQRNKRYAHFRKAITTSDEAGHPDPVVSRSTGSNELGQIFLPLELECIVLR